MEFDHSYYAKTIFDALDCMPQEHIATAVQHIGQFGVDCCVEHILEVSGPFNPLLDVLRRRVTEAAE